MNKVVLVLEPDADGSLHLPVPPELRGGKVKVEATLTQVTPGAEETPHAPPLAKGFGSLKGKISLAPDFDDTPEDFRDYIESGCYWIRTRYCGSSRETTR